MAAAVAFGTVSLGPAGIFPYDHGPPEPNQGRKRDSTPEPASQFTDIDDILPSNLAMPGLFLESGGDVVEGRSRDNPIMIEESGPDSDSDSDSDSEDELPDPQDLLFGRLLSNKEADVAYGSTRAAATGHEYGAASGERGEEDGGVVMEPITCDTVGVVPTLTPTAVVATESGDSLHLEDGDGSSSDDGGATGTDLSRTKRRKRTRSLSSVDSLVCDPGTSDLDRNPNPDCDTNSERLREGPRLSKRRRQHLRTAGEPEPTPMRTPTPNPNAGLSPSSATGSGDTHDRMDIEQPGTECNGEAIAIGISGNGASGHAKTADREGSDDPDDDGDDGDNDGLLQSVEPAKQRASTILQQSSGCRQRTEDEAVHELGELRKSMRGDRTVDNDDGNDDDHHDDDHHCRHHRPRPPVQATARRHRSTKPSRTATPAVPCAQPSAVELMDQRTPGPERQSPAAEPAPVPPPQPHRPPLSAAGKGTSHPERHDGDDAGRIQLRPPKITEMFLAVTIRTAGDILQMSHDEPAKLIKSASAHAGKAEDVTIKPLGPAGTWQVSGRLHLRNARHSGSTLKPLVVRQPTLAGSVPSWDLRKRVRALCEGAAYGVEVACHTGTEGDGVLNHGRRRFHDDGIGGGGYGNGSDGDGDDDYDDDYDDDDGGDEVTGRRNRRWDPVDEQRLLAWRKEGKPWKWIFDQLPDRTQGAVRVRWNMLKPREQ